MNEIQSIVTQLMIVGFDGHAFGDDRISQLLAGGEWGGVIFFDQDYPYFIESNQHRPKNIIDPEQVTGLNHQFKMAFPSLFRSIDVEGGRDWVIGQNGSRERFGVNRLKPCYGFSVTQSAAELGLLYEQGQHQQVERYCDDIAQQLSDSGFNLVFAPVVDMNINHHSPVIGVMNRSYSQQLETVIACARLMISACKKKGVQCCLKHYPGHGNALTDTHEIFTDITTTWCEEELIPFIKLGGECGMIMTSHLYHGDISSQVVSQSPEWIFKLRQSGFDGVIITDDIQMAAAIDANKDRVTQVASAIIRAWRAGNDLIIVGRQLQRIDYHELIAIVDQLVDQVKNDQAILLKLQAALSRVSSLKHCHDN